MEWPSLRFWVCSVIKYLVWEIISVYFFFAGRKFWKFLLLGELCQWRSFKKCHSIGKCTVGISVDFIFCRDILFLQIRYCTHIQADLDPCSVKVLSLAAKI